jgi:hypothetical protein
MKEADVVVAGLRLVVEAELGVSPVEGAGVDDRSADRRAVPSDPLGQGVHDHVGSMVDRAQEVGRREGRVDDQRQLVAMRDIGHCRHVEHVEHRVADRLPEDRARLVVDRPLEVPGIGRVHEAHGDPELRQDVVEHRVRSAVEVVGRDDLVAGLGDVDDRVVDGRRPGREGEGRGAALESRQALLEDIVGGVHQARVDVPQLLE